MESITKNNIKHHQNVFSKLSLMEEDIILLYNFFDKAVNKKNKILIFGNGGSAADSQHFAAELMVKFEKKRKPISAISLTTDTSILTAAGNDFSFDSIFSRQVEGLAQEDDLVIGISTSGTSINVLNGLKQAYKLKAKTILLTGSKKVSHKYINFVFNVPSSTTSRIQEAHLFIYHIICTLIDQ